jgi:parallel beta-helix repeat protein
MISLILKAVLLLRLLLAQLPRQLAAEKRGRITVFPLLLVALAPLSTSPTAPTDVRTIHVSTYPQLLAACQSARPNDTILLAPGTYTVTRASRIMIADRPGPVLVKGATDNPADVIVQGKGQDDPSVDMVFDLDNSPRWTFENLTTRNSYYHGFKFNGSSSDCVLRNVVMRDHGESGVKGTSEPEKGVYPDRLLVERCDIGFSTGKGGSRSVVEGIDGVGVNGWTVRNSRFINVVAAGGGSAYGVFTKGNSSNTIIDANRFENCYIGASFGGGGTGTPYFRDKDRTYEHRGGIIRNNEFIRCRDAAIYINKGRNCNISNNTLFECMLTIQLRYAESSGRICNNLIRRSPSNPEEPAVRLRNGATLLADAANLISGDGSDFVRASGSDTQIDTHLTSRSSAIDAGTKVENIEADVARDYDGRLRPYGKGYDVGAHEWRP